MNTKMDTSNVVALFPLPENPALTLPPRNPQKTNNEGLSDLKRVIHANTVRFDGREDYPVVTSFLLEAALKICIAERGPQSRVREVLSLVDTEAQFSIRTLYAQKSDAPIRKHSFYDGQINVIRQILGKCREVM